MRPRRFPTATDDGQTDVHGAARWPPTCTCPLHQRRRLLVGGSAAVVGLAAGGAALPAWARDGVVVGERSIAAGWVPAEQIEAASAQQYRQMLQQYGQVHRLAKPENAQLIRLRAISERLIPYVMSPNLHSTPRAANWKWEVNLLASSQVNAFCMPGGKIAFYYGILEKLRLTDDEVAMVMGHEIAHALREHARERMGKTAATGTAIEIGAALFGLGAVGRQLAGMGGQVLTLQFSRSDESEADKIGLDLAARAGYDPQAGITLWQKMTRANTGAPPQWLSTHPSGTTRIRDMQAELPDVTGLYARADKPPRHYDLAPPLPAIAQQSPEPRMR